MPRPWAMIPFKEDLTSQVNGERTDFSVTRTYKLNSLEVYRNGQKLIQEGASGGFVILTNSTFRVNFTPVQGERIDVIYLRSS